MLHKLHKLAALLSTTMVLVATPALAQVQETNDASITLHVLTTLQIAKVTDATFADVYSNAGTVSTNQPAQWTVTSDLGASLNYVVSVPATLNDGSGHTITLTPSGNGCNVRHDDGSGGNVQNYFGCETGTTVTLPVNVGASTVFGLIPGELDAAVGAVPPGDYTGTTTLTVTVQ